MSELFHEFLSTNFTITQEIKKSSKSKLYDKTLYEDFSKKVNLSNGLPTNSVLDKDKNGPYKIDISFFSPRLGINYLHNNKFPVY